MAGEAKGRQVSKRKSYTPTMTVDRDEQRHLANVYHSGDKSKDPYPTIHTNAPSQAYRAGWERIFGKRRK